MKRAKDLNWKLIEWMTADEFDDPDYPGSWVHMDPKTILLCEWLRKNTGWPLIIHNKFGVHGAVCVTRGHHASNSLHNWDHPEGCSAVDFHFKTDASVREQARAVIHAGFTGIGIYQDCWKWPKAPGGILPVGFHCDRRKFFQVWKFENGTYDYLLR